MRPTMWSHHLSIFIFLPIYLVGSNSTFYFPLLPHPLLGGGGGGGGSGQSHLPNP